MADALTVKADAIRELAAIAAGSNPRQSPLIEEFLQCPDWQLAATVMVRALSECARCPAQQGVCPPPGWMPPA